MADLLQIKEYGYVAIDQVKNQLLEADGDKLSIVEVIPQLIEAQSTSVELVVTNDPQAVVVVTDPIILISDSASWNNTSGGSNSIGVNIWDEDTLIARNVTDINFAGKDVLAKNQGLGKVTIFIPTPSYVSHFNSNDGVNDGVIPDVPTFNRYVSIPTSEGTPFTIGDWSEQQIHQVVSSPTLNYQTPVPCSFFDNTTSFTAVVFNASSVPVVTFTTPAITGNGSHISTDNVVTVSVSGWNSDSDKFQARVAFTINIGLLYLEGGRFGVSFQHDNATEGTFYKVQNPLFYDSNTHAATIATTAITQKWATSSKYLSGIRYYTLWDSFTISSSGLGGLNSNSYPEIVLATNCDDFGISSLQLTTNDLQNWSSQWNHDTAMYEGDQAITKQNHRFVGDAYIHTAIMDWGVSQSVDSAPLKVAIDTYPQSSTDLLENFEDEYYRQDEGFCSGYPDGNWLKDVPLKQGEAMIFGGQLIAPSEAHTIDHNAVTPISSWAEYIPFNENGNANPDYSDLVCPVNYYRTFVEADAYREIMNWQIYLDGEFISGNARDDIESGFIEIYIRRLGSTMTTNVGPTATPLAVHGPLYSLGTFDDGITDGYVRTDNSRGNMIACTSGGIATQHGIHFHICILDPRIKLDSIRLEFN